MVVLGDDSMLPRKIYLDRLFDNFLEEDRGSMKCDLYEKDGVYYLEADIPGFSKSDIKVDFQNGYLTVSAEKEEEKEEENKNYLRKERIYGSVTRKFYFGDQVNEEEIKAEFKDGNLKVSLPKQVEQETKTSIEIL